MCSDTCSESSSVISMDEEDTFIETSSSIRVAPRSIFNDYWKRIGCEAFSLRSSATGIHARVREEALNEPTSACDAVPASLSASARRSIFTASASEPLLTHLSHSSGNGMRYIQSVSAIGRRKPREASSCLRKSKFSGESEQLNCSVSSISSTVSFNDEVTVLHFEKPKEVYGHEGWSDYFV